MAEETPSETPSRTRRPWLVAAAVIVAAVAGFFIWRFLSPRESTDDAQVNGHVSPVAARVGGTVLAIRVQDNQIVKAGDVLIEIDPRDYQIALARAEADLAAAEAVARSARTGVPVTSANARSEQNITEAGTGTAEAALRAADRDVEASQAKVVGAQARVAEATANAARAAQDLARLRPLLAKDEISRQQFDLATSNDQSARAAVDAANAGVKEAEANLAVSQARREQSSNALLQAQSQARAAATAPQQIAQTEAQAAGADAQVLQARAAVDQAKLSLDRATVRAPSNGVVSKRTVEAGQIVQSGQPVMAITSLDDVWVVANFKETQLDRIRMGQHAEIEVDAYGGREYAGHVESIAAATGATFSLLPADNATGNFVKVVQRVPVKVLLDKPADPAFVLRPGMSVTATVYMH